MIEQNQAPLSDRVLDDEMDLQELLEVLWLERWMIVAIIFASAVISIVFSLTLTEIFRAEATLIPAENRQSTSPLAGQLGGAAALIGISLPTTADGGRITNALAILRSREFAIQFIEKHDALPSLFAGVWDSENQRSVIDPNIYNIATKEWLRDGGIPSVLQAYRAFSQILKVSQDRDTGIVHVAIEWQDPIIAAHWVNALVAEINFNVKQADLAEANNSIAYLRRQLDATQLVEMQRVFYQLIESQTRVTMLADVRDEYVFQVIDPAIVPDQKIRPRRSLIVVISTLAGGMLAILIALIRRIFWRDEIKVNG